jgi:hypothetical protein
MQTGTDMRFLIHGAVQPETAAALAAREHVCHGLQELTDDSAILQQAAGNAEALLPLLEKRGWHLLTTDRGLVGQVYEKKVNFGGAIVLILDDPAGPAGQDRAVTRLFERYRRLTPRRLYTVTPNRVKIRQLPGAG